MSKFTAKVADLKKALLVAVLATGEAIDSIKSQALVEVNGDKARIFTTDEDRIAYSWFPVESPESDVGFMADPKSLLATLGTSDRDSVQLDYIAESMTLNIYASDDADAYVSQACLDPMQFLAFMNDISSATVIDTVDTEVVKAAFKFIQGYVYQDDKNKYSNMFIKEGILYGSNGHSIVGACLSPDLKKIFTLTVRRPMISAILSLIEKMDLNQVCIKETDKMLVFTSEDNQSGFGFRKSNQEMPKMPITVTSAAVGKGISIDRTTLIKKITRLSTTLRGEKLGLSLVAEGDVLTMQTLTERKSVERMPCKRNDGSNASVRIVMECPMLKSILSSLITPAVEFIVDSNSYYIFSVAELLIDGTDKKPITCMARISRPREV